MALDFVSSLADTLTRATSEGIKGFRAFQEEEEETQAKAKAEAQARVKWRETLAGGPDKAFEVWGDEYLKDAKLAYGIDIPTREEDVLGPVTEQVEGFKVMPKTAPTAMERFRAGERGEPFVPKVFPTTKEVTVQKKVGMKRVLALPGRTGAGTLGDLFPEAKGTAIGSLPIPDLSTLNTAVSVGKAMGWISDADADKVEVIFQGKTYNVSPSEALRFAQAQTKAGAETMDITIEGKLFKSVTPYQAAQLVIAEGNLKARRAADARQAAKQKDGDDIVLRRQVINDIRAARAEVASLESQVDSLRREAVARTGSTDPKLWGLIVRQEYQKKQAELTAARGKLKSLQESGANLGGPGAAPTAPAPAPARPQAKKVISQATYQKLRQRGYSDAEIRSKYTVQP